MNSDNSKTKAELILELQSIRKRLNSGSFSTVAEVEKKPELSERKYQELFENSADAILIIQDGIFIDCNKATVEMLRYTSKEELLKTHPSELSPEKQPDGRSSFEKADEMMAIALEKGSHRFEWSHIHSDNEVFPVEVLLTPIHTSDDTLIIHTVWRDISERKLAEKELLKAKKAAEESQARYRILSDATIEGITIHDKGIIVDGSDSFVELFGYDSLDEMIGMNVVDLASEDTREIVRHNSKSENEMPYEATGLRKDNTTFPIIVTGKDIPIEGKTYRIASVRDISEQKQAEMQLKEYSENLEKMVKDRTKKLEDAQNQLIRKEKLASLGQLAGSVGHELRNPLGVISNAVYYLNAFVDLDDIAKEQLEMITHEVKTSSRIISELLDFGKVPIAQKEKIYLSEFVDQIIKKQQLPENIEVIIEIESKLMALNSDPLHLEQIMVNLIWNACQAMPKGGKLTVEALSKKDKTIINVTDTGKGIPKKNIDKIFEPLFTTRAKGIGLGLAVSKNLVEANGGIITFNNTEGRGVTFTLEFSDK